eukprot:TRINITY_DN16714_c0_g1_i1.p1 TRINITY_DN16714_c0_g1~~TRINITY_DN16714_c0_g1_i1.p1  ORF type:complete len:466 (+),score=35.08 TRINITY_DN16714_c0_g1_i1:44-1441(+)
MIRIYVRSICGTMTPVDVCGDQKIEGLYQAVGEATQLDDRTFDIVFNGEVLWKWGRQVTVEACGLVEDSEVSLRYKDPMYVHILELAEPTRVNIFDVLRRGYHEQDADPDAQFVLDLSVPDSAPRVNILGFRHVNVVCNTPNTHLGNSFLFRCRALTTLSFRWASFSSIGDSFLYGCHNLTSVDFGHQPYVTSIGRGFLSTCDCLRTVDMSAFPNIRSIGDDFLLGCHALTSVDLSAQGNVTTIGNKFLHSCRSIMMLDMSACSQVTSIGMEFLANCISLASVNLSFQNVTGIPDYFLSSSGITSINLGSFRHVTGIGNFFLSGTDVGATGRYFLSHCPPLTSIDLSPLSSVTYIGSCFLAGCTSLTSANLNLPRVTCIRDNFLSDTALIIADLSSLSRASIIGGNILGGCRSLQLIAAWRLPQGTREELRRRFGSRIVWADSASYFAPFSMSSFPRPPHGFTRW